MPVERPVNTPVAGTMLPIAGGDRLLHVPPTVEQSRSIVWPWQIAGEAGVIAAGIGLIVTTPVLVHPAAVVYVTGAVPAMLPTTAPVVLLSVMLPLVVLHVPPEGLEPKVVLLPWQITNDGVPVIGPGNGLTVSTAEEEQPAPRE